MYTAQDTTEGVPVRGEQAYRALKRRVLAGEFALGERLAEERLAHELEVSRTPVREALARLHAEHLVERHPQGGYCPTAPDLHTMLELYEIRWALELDALERPRRRGHRHDEASLERLRDDWRGLEVPASDAAVDPQFVFLDEDFHLRLLDAAGNREAGELLARVNERIRPVRMHDFLTVTRVASTIDQHLDIVDTLLLGDVDGARDRLEHHFGESLEVVEQRAAAALARMAAIGRRSAR